MPEFESIKGVAHVAASGIGSGALKPGPSRLTATAMAPVRFAALAVTAFLLSISSAPAFAEAICPIPLGEHASYLVSYKVERVKPKPEIAYQGSVTVTPGQPGISQATNTERRGYFRAPKERADLETGMTLVLVAVSGRNGDPDGLSYDFAQVDLVAMRQVSGVAGTFESPQIATRKVAGMSNIDLARPVVLELPVSGSDTPLRVTLETRLCTAH